MVGHSQSLGWLATSEFGPRQFLPEKNLALKYHYQTSNPSWTLSTLVLLLLLSLMILLWCLLLLLFIQCLVVVNDKCTKKLNRGLCLSSTKNCADYDSRGFEPATPVAGPATLKCMLYCLFDMEPRIFISYSFENWDPCVRFKYKTISERYQGAEVYLYV